MKPFRAIALLLATTAALYAVVTNPATPPVHTGTDNWMLRRLGDYEQAMKDAMTGAGTNTYAYVAGTGATTIATGKLTWIVYPIGGTCTINVGGAGVITLTEGESRGTTALPGWTTSASVVVANGTGTAKWSYQTPN